MNTIKRIKLVADKFLLKFAFPRRSPSAVIRAVREIYPLNWSPERLEGFIKLVNKSKLKELSIDELKRFANVLPTLKEAHPMEENKPYYLYRYFGQDGEDIILSTLFAGQKTGTYVDVGAHHPYRFSNTYYFYRRGWRGVNIDPDPEFKSLFDKSRPEDVNLQLGISSHAGELDLYIFEDSALNTFSKERADQIVARGKYELTEQAKVKIDTLANVLGKHLPQTPIDFMSIDVEKQELDVLKSNDWTRFSPRYLLVEILGIDLEDIEQSEVHRFVSAKGYKLIAKTLRTSFYKLQK